MRTGLGQLGKSFGPVEAGQEAPAPPTLSLSVSGTTVTATITGDAGATHYLKYRTTNQAWQDGGSRLGDGDIAVADLTSGQLYIFIVYSQIDSGSYSTPSRAEIAYPAATGEVAPTGEIGTAMVALRTMISESETFQNAVGVEVAANALPFIHLAEYTLEDEDVENFDRPFCLICRSGSDNSEKDSLDTFHPSVAFSIRFEQELTEAYKETAEADNAEIYFTNFVDGVSADCHDLSALPGYLMIRNWETVDGPYRIKERNTEIYGIEKSVGWGLEG